MGMTEIVGQSKRMDQLRTAVHKYARSKKNVVVVGEAGVGKGEFGEWIHRMSKEAKKPCVLVALDSMDDTKFSDLVEGILSNREFRNPMTPQFGSFRVPPGSSLVVEHVDRASVLNQRLLCRLIEASQEKKLALRVIVTLNDAPSVAFREGRLQECLRASLRSWGVLEVPALREHPEDIPDLVEHFIKELGKKHTLGEVVIDINAMSVLVRHEWKGNVRELKESIERSILESEDQTTFNVPQDLVNEHAEVNRMLERIDQGISFSIDHSLDIIERRVLERVLEKYELNQSKAAEFLRITEDTLRYRMKRLGIPTAQQR